jgi:hypothetical protein
LKRGEIYRTSEKVAERGHKPGFYVVFRAISSLETRMSRRLYVPAYSEILGLLAIVLGISESLPRECAVRCDFLDLDVQEETDTFCKFPAGREAARTGRCSLLCTGN